MKESTFNLFDMAIVFVLDQEGFYSDHANDRGEETCLGISRRYHPDWNGWELVDEIKASVDHDQDRFMALMGGELNDADTNELAELAMGYYFKAFWMHYDCHELPGLIAMAYFDAVVQHHPKSAAMLLQEAIGVNADGVIGPITKARVENADQVTVVDRFLAKRLSYYRDLAMQPSQAGFFEGWAWRMVRLSRFLADPATTVAEIESRNPLLQA